MSNKCVLCDKKLSFWNQPIFGKGILKSNERVCSSCFMRINNNFPKTASNLKRYELKEIIELLNSRAHVFSVEATTFVEKEIKKESGKWEIIHRKTERWVELGFGDNENFPGYGKLYEREFKVWYCVIGSKEQKSIQKCTDKYPLNYDPKNYQNITGEGVYVERLTNTRGYEALYTALDNKNRKRWYFALNNKKPLWIQTERAE
tara:strand:+ start:18580 stop:19191 length:612 start_codon:yes stop_codon:yes gene_type:complete